MDISVILSARIGQQELTKDDRLHVVVSNRTKGTDEDFFLLPSKTFLDLVKGEKSLKDKRIVLKGSMSSEKAPDSEEWKPVIRPYKLLSLTTDSEVSTDYVEASFSGVADFKSPRNTNGKTVLSFSTKITRENKDGKQSFTYVRSTLWGDMADKFYDCSDQQGLEVTVIGGLTPSSYTNNKGQLVQEYQVWVNDMRVHGSSIPPKNAQSSSPLTGKFSTARSGADNAKLPF